MTKTYSEILKYMEKINPDVIKLIGFDECVVGICESFDGTRLLYSEKKIIENLKKNITEKDALEYFEREILSKYFGEYNPIFLMDLE